MWKNWLHIPILVFLACLLLFVWAYYLSWEKEVREVNMDNAEESSIEHEDLLKKEIIAPDF